MCKEWGGARISVLGRTGKLSGGMFSDMTSWPQRVPSRHSILSVTEASYTGTISTAQFNIQTCIYWASVCQMDWMTWWRLSHTSSSHTSWPHYTGSLSSSFLHSGNKALSSHFLSLPGASQESANAFAYEILIISYTWGQHHSRELSGITSVAELSSFREFHGSPFSPLSATHPGFYNIEETDF